MPDLGVDWDAPFLDHNVVKRSTLQDNSTDYSNIIKVTTWEYSILHWSIIDQFLVVGIATDGSVVVSRDSLLTFKAFDLIPKTAKCYQAWSSKANGNYICVLCDTGIYSSTDRAVTFIHHPQEVNRKFQDYEFHPTNPQFGLAVDRNNPRQLYMTDDFGASWRLVRGGVSQFDWCRAGLGGIAEGRVCVIADNKFQYSNDYGHTWSTPLVEDARFFNIHDRFFTLLGFVNDSYTFFVSADDGTTFHRAVLPRGVSVGPINRNALIEDSNGVIWVVVNSGPTVPDKQQAGNLYTSDAEGYEFSLVLKGVHTYNGLWDIELIRFMEGTLFANRLVDAEVSKPKLRTSITYDNGDSWNLLAHPDRDIKGKKYDCPKGEECSLHLFGITTWLGVGGDGYFGDFYTQEDAVGLIVGTGNVGAYLDTDSEEINTYMSLDGGVVWEEVMKGSTIYDFGDFGGLVVLAFNRVPTKKLYFSWNGGKSFDYVTLPKKVVVINIVTVSSHSEIFLILSYEKVGEATIRRIWGVDFGTLHTRNCSDADYEEWAPHKNHCILGHNTIYRRRKTDAACYTEEDINKIVSVTNCPCTENDYECDVNFDRTETSGQCAYNGNDLEVLSQKAGCSKKEEHYKVSSGYRKIPGDTCVGDLAQFAPSVRDCPVNGTTVIVDGNNMQVALIAFAGVLLAFVALVVGFCFGVRDERVRKMFPWLNQAPAWVTAGYSNSLVVAEMGDEFEDDAVKSDSGELSTSLSD